MTSPENVAKIREKAVAKRLKETKKIEKKDKSNKNDNKMGKKSRKSTEKRKGEVSPDADTEEREKCLSCKNDMPKNQNRNNTIHCNDCDRPAHLSCVKVSTAGFTCDVCESIE